MQIASLDWPQCITSFGKNFQKKSKNFLTGKNENKFKPVRKFFYLFALNTIYYKFKENHQIVTKATYIVWYYFKWKQLYFKYMDRQNIKSVTSSSLY